MGLPNKLLYNNYHDFAPRLGLAWRPFGNNKTVVRTGAGIFYLMTNGNNWWTLPSSTCRSLWTNRTAGHGKRLPDAECAELLPAIQFECELCHATHLRLQPSHEDASDVPVELRDSARVNQGPAPSKSHTWAIRVRTLSTRSRKTYLRSVRPIFAPSNNGVRIRRLVPEATMTIGTTQITNALELKLEQRFSHGVNFLLGYSWSKAIDGSTNDQGGGDGADNPFNLASMRGLSNLRRQGQRFVLSGGWDIPVGKGRAFMTSMPRAADALLGGWQIGGISRCREFPFTPSMSSDPANVGFAYARRPDVIGTGKVDNCTARNASTSCGLPCSCSLHDRQRRTNILRGPGIANLDLSIFKNFSFTERMCLQFRAEAFNALNHTQFNNPNTNIELPESGGQYRTPQRTRESASSASSCISSLA